MRYFQRMTRHTPHPDRHTSPTRHTWRPPIDEDDTLTVNGTDTAIALGTAVVAIVIAVILTAMNQPLGGSALAVALVLGGHLLVWHRQATRSQK